MNWNIPTKTVPGLEAGGGVSETVQEPGLTIRALVEKYTKTGFVPGGMRQTFYMDEVGFDDQDWNEFRQMDIVEQTAIAEQARAILDQYNEDMEAAEKARLEKLAKVKQKVKAPESEEEEEEEEDSEN